MIKTFKAFNESIDDDDSIESICENFSITNYSINNDGTIDVDGDVNLEGYDLYKLPLKFRNVSGNFNCCDNYITDLRGCPFSIGCYFDCSNNELITLEGAPQSVDGDFHCSENKLISLEGAPQSVRGNFECDHNRLITLEGAPKSVGGSFYCGDNRLITLEGAPKSVGGNLSCSDNQLKSLEYLSNFGGNLYCVDNPISKWLSQIDYENDQDLEAFLDFNIHCDDPDDINQEKIDQINNG